MAANDMNTEAPGGAGQLLQRPERPCAFVIFGAGGDLTRRKLIPALYNLSCQDLLPARFAVLGYAIEGMIDESFRESMGVATKRSPEVLAFRQRLWNEFSPRLHYLAADFQGDAGYVRLGERLREMDEQHDCGGFRIFYLATPPSFYATIIRNLGKHGLAGARTSVIVEKPFGRDLSSARQLNQIIHEVFDEDQIYRIDHYLGKETVQNILAFRFANSIIEPIWNRNYVDHVQITASETLGVEHRARYYEEAGCIRDMFQNHLLQILALIAMEPPVRSHGQSVRDRKADLLRAIEAVDPKKLGGAAVAGQYGPGAIDGQPAPGYREEPGVAPDSTTETFAALKLTIDNWRWAGVPFYLRSGKRMPKKLTFVAIQFKRVPHLFFADTRQDQIEPNELIIRVQPNEGISLKLGAKMPGPAMHIRQMQMNFSYSDAFGEFPATAYETLLLDAMEADPTLFNRSDAVELSWQILDPVLRSRKLAAPGSFPNYAAGHWGPASADALLAANGHIWKNSTDLSRFYLTGVA